MKDRNEAENGKEFMIGIQIGCVFELKKVFQGR